MALLYTKIFKLAKNNFNLMTIKLIEWILKFVNFESSEIKFQKNISTRHVVKFKADAVFVDKGRNSLC